MPVFDGNEADEAPLAIVLSPILGGQGFILFRRGDLDKLEAPPVQGSLRLVLFPTQFHGAKVGCLRLSRNKSVYNKFCLEAS